jgi:hypothetical protein
MQEKSSRGRYTASDARRAEKVGYRVGQWNEVQEAIQTENKEDHARRERSAWHKLEAGIEPARVVVKTTAIRET